MPATDTCRWCHGTGWATLIDNITGEAYDVPCPGDCPVYPPDVAGIGEAPF